MNSLFKTCSLVCVLCVVAYGSRAGAQDAHIVANGEALSLNVRDFGAKGDAKSDDTAPFQRALDECSKRGGGLVEVPTGRYLIKTHLVVPPNVTLEGVFRAPPAYVSDFMGLAPSTETIMGHALSGRTSDSSPEQFLSGSVLLAVEGEGLPKGTPFITLNTNSTLKGVVIFYPNQTDSNPPVAYPWTVAVSEKGATQPAVIDVLMVNPYQAVDFGSYWSTRCLIRNLYAEALYRGVYVDNCMDTARLEDVHLGAFWRPYVMGGWPGGPAHTFSWDHGEGFVIGRTDAMTIQNCVGNGGYKIGFHFTRTSPADTTRGAPCPQLAANLREVDYPAGNVMITGGGFDISRTPVLVEDSYPALGISFVNCYFAGQIVVAPSNRGMVRFNACGFQDIAGLYTDKSESNWPMVESAGEGRVSFNDCSFDDYSSYVNRGGTVTIIHDSARSLGVSNCLITSAASPAHPGMQMPTVHEDQQIIIDPQARSAVILGNDFSGRMVISNKSSGTVQTANNVDQTGKQ
jgi:Pectate lyase superfamily protein